MRPFGLMLLVFALTALVLPGWTAQDKDDVKKDAEKKDAKADKKGEEKKGDDAKDEKKKDETPKKTSSKKTIDPEEEKIIKGTFPPMRARIQQMNADSSGEFTVQFPYPFPAKVQAANQWRLQQLQLKSPPYQVMIDYKKKLSEANMVEVRTGQGMKVRTSFFPMEYDDKGNLKRPTAKQIAAMKGASRLPGFPAQFDALKAGQIVDIYLAKTPAPKKTAAKDKKKILDEDIDDAVLKPEVLMVVVVIEAPQRP